MTAGSEGKGLRFSFATKVNPTLFSPEVGRILSACSNLKHRVLLATCYGGGLRISEVVALKVRHIDGNRVRLCHKDYRDRNHFKVIE